MRQSPPFWSQSVPPGIRGWLGFVKKRDWLWWWGAWYSVMTFFKCWSTIILRSKPLSIRGRTPTCFTQKGFQIWLKCCTWIWYFSIFSWSQKVQLRQGGPGAQGPGRRGEPGHAVDVLPLPLLDWSGGRVRKGRRGRKLSRKRPDFFLWLLATKKLWDKRVSSFEMPSCGRCWIRLCL